MLLLMEHIDARKFLKDARKTQRRERDAGESLTRLKINDSKSSISLASAFARVRFFFFSYSFKLKDDYDLIAFFLKHLKLLPEKSEPSKSLSKIGFKNWPNHFP